MKYDREGNQICTVKVGERVIVMGRPEKVIVDNIQWIPSEQRYRIALDWGPYGMSRVWSDDEGKVWTRYISSN